MTENKKIAPNAVGTKVKKRKPDTVTVINYIMAIILLQAFISGFFLIYAAATYEEPKDKSFYIEESITYTISSGDTIWSLADKYCPDDMQKNEWCYYVCKYNGIKGNIYPGDKIEVGSVIFNG